VRIISVISEELFKVQPAEYQSHIIPESARFDCMVVSTGTKRILPVAGLGPITEEYSLTSDWDDRWRTGGLEADVISEAHLDLESIISGVSKFANEREQRLERQRKALSSLV